MTIKEIREKYNLTQKKLSELTGIPKRSIENWENGSRAVKDYLPDLIEAKLKITLIYEIGGKDMAGFDLGYTICFVRERAEDVEGRYFRYVLKHDIDIDDDENIFVKNLFEARDLGGVLADKIANAKDAAAIMNRINELKEFILNQKED